jgi:hypothetical protein
MMVSILGALGGALLPVICLGGEVADPIFIITGLIVGVVLGVLLGRITREVYAWESPAVWTSVIVIVAGVGSTGVLIGLLHLLSQFVGGD